MQQSDTMKLNPLDAIMPKVHSDNTLLLQVRKIVENHGGCSPAAKFLEVDKTTLWRFIKTGCAIERTRVTLRKSVVRHENAINENSSALNKTLQGKEATLSLDDLQRMKTMLQMMILVIDSYAASAPNAPVNFASFGESSTSALDRSTSTLGG